MSVFHDEVEIEDFEYNEEEQMYYYPCPCGDRFQISKEDLLNGEEQAECPSCSLIVKVIYDKELFVLQSMEDVSREAGTHSLFGTDSKTNPKILPVRKNILKVFHHKKTAQL